MTLDASSQALVDQVAESGAPPIQEMAVADVRAMGAGFADLAGPPVEVASVDDIEIPTSAGSVPARVLRPETPCGVIVWFHGGGWVFGSIADADRIGRRLAVATDCAVVIVEYRLAPEHRAPAAAEDAIDATLWVAEHVVDVAGADVPVVVAGDSAGGNLAAVAARAAADAHVALAGQVLVQPVTDADFNRPSYCAEENQLLLNRAAMEFFFEHYEPDVENRSGPLISPLRHTPPADTAAAVIVTSEHDPLRDEGEAYAEHLAAAGVPVVHRSFDGQMHAFFLFPAAIPAADEALEFIATELAPLLGAHRHTAEVSS